MTTGKNLYRVIGLMSGTSLDGIDAALIEIKVKPTFQVKTIQFTTVPYTGDVKKQLKQLCMPDQGTLPLLSAMNMKLGGLFAKAAETVCKKSGLKRKDIDLISSHGQTVLERFGCDSDAKEAVAFAILGCMYFIKQPNNVPSATGATHPVPLGKIAWGSNHLQGGA